ncbi:hypothetical protein ON010_g14063 [Phytophthora cinnamomi]|nr:hypothetical protein ON010_g14063 [Phytophthora cinnamomi]
MSFTPASSACNNNKSRATRQPPSLQTLSSALLSQQATHRLDGLVDHLDAEVHGLLAEDLLLVLGRLDNLLGVHGSRRADDDGVDLRVAEDVGRVLGPASDAEVRGHGLGHVADGVGDLLYRSRGVGSSRGATETSGERTYHGDGGARALQALRVHLADAATAHEADAQRFGRVRVEHGGEGFRRGGGGESRSALQTRCARLDKYDRTLEYTQTSIFEPLRRGALTGSERLRAQIRIIVDSVSSLPEEGPSKSPGFGGPTNFKSRGPNVGLPSVKYESEEPGGLLKLNLQNLVASFSDWLTLEIKSPSVLLADNFDCHVLEEGQEVIARETSATVCALPADSTAVCQPLHVGVMGPLKKNLRALWLTDFRKGKVHASQKRLISIKRIIRAWEMISTDVYHLDNKNSLAVIRWMHDPRVMDEAASHGHLELVKWLHSNRPEGCTPDAMDRAAAHGHLEVIQWLHLNRTYGIYQKSYGISRKGKSFGCSEMVARPYRRTWSKGNIDIPAASGHLELVSWLHFTGDAVCSEFAMDRAAANGHLDVVNFLHEHSREGCSREATIKAAEGNHLDILKYLISTVEAKCSSVTVKAAASNGHFDSVKWLIEDQSVKCQEVVTLSRWAAALYMDAA